jgi:hypothetical protein
MDAMKIIVRMATLFLLVFGGLNARAIEPGNPLVSHIYTADPSGHVHDGRVYIYASHDQDNAGTFTMVDYHVLSSADLVTWEDHGVVLKVSDVPWAANRMWAPDCVYKDGTYYFYFPARDSSQKFRIGVATSTSPAGPFTPEDDYMVGTFSIDPVVFLDDDGEAYMYWGGRGAQGGNYPYVAKLDDTMKQMDGDYVELTSVDYYYEGPWMHKLDGIYYLSYSTGSYHPDHPDKPVIAYATATSPLGPFTYRGVVNGEVSGNTNHHSTMKYKGQWYFFYHNADLSGGINTRRSVVADYLHFNDDGSMREVIQTDLGIGKYDGLSAIEAENYSETSTVEKRESSDGGLHVVLDPSDELIFNRVDFDYQQSDTLEVRVASTSAAGRLEISTTGGVVIATVQIPETGGSQAWQTISAPIETLTGVHSLSLIYSNTETNQLALDWFAFSGEILEPEEPINLALSGIATQSSTNYTAAASRAIDGNTDGIWANRSVTHTLTEDQPWWRVDLGEICAVSEIRIWNRTDSNTDRLSNYDVTVFDEDELSVWTSYQATRPNPSVSLDTGTVTGRYVVVQLRDTEALSLAEVEVMGLVLDFPVEKRIEYTFETPENIVGTTSNIVYTAPDVNTFGAGVTVSNLELSDSDEPELRYGRIENIGGGSVEAAVTDRAVEGIISFSMTMDESVSVSLTNLAFNTSLRNTLGETTVSWNFYTVVAGMTNNETSGGFVHDGETDYQSPSDAAGKVALTGLTDLSDTTVTFVWVLDGSRNNAFEVLALGLDNIILKGFVAASKTPVDGIEGVVLSGGGEVAITWSAFAGNSYGVMATTNLVDGSWVEITNGISGHNAPVSVTNAITERQRFFRVYLEE